jgi:biopolymer transport protein ExbD
VRLPDPPRRETGENMIPLINVVFLLLIFFMLAGVLAAPEPFRIQPPASQSDARLENRDWTLLVTADGQLALDGEVLPQSALEPAVARLLEEHPDARIKLKADGDITARALIEVMDALRRAGAERVTLLTRRSAG